jgi:predicted acylesterase/phospholipase RssA
MESFSILALGGGGAKGFLEVGTLLELEDIVGSLDKHFVDGIYGCSIGSIIATGIAFGLSMMQIHDLLFKHFSIDDIYKTLDMSKIDEMLKGKGVFDIKILETKLIHAFNSVGIQIEKKVLSDALIPLKIQSSNITKGVPTIFQNNVSVIKALSCSCAIPFIFKPVHLNDSLYVDGGFLTNVLTSIIPISEREKTLSIAIIQSDPSISPNKLRSMKPIEFLNKMYKTACLYERHKFSYKNTIELQYRNGSGFTSFTQSEKEEMILLGRSALRNFLAECSNKESIKI